MDSTTCHAPRTQFSTSPVLSPDNRVDSSRLVAPSFEEAPMSNGYGMSADEWRDSKAQRAAADFQKLPHACTVYARNDGLLHDQESKALCAAGFCLWRRGEHSANSDAEAEVLMVWEDRQKQRKLSFPGGKRDSDAETPIKVAARETNEETGYTLARAVELENTAGRMVVWMPVGRFALFFHEVSDTADLTLDQRFVRQADEPEIVKLEWVRVSDLAVSHTHHFHKFTRILIHQLQSAELSLCFPAELAALMTPSGSDSHPRHLSPQARPRSPPASRMTVLGAQEQQLDAARYKTAMCRYYPHYSRGDACTFAHGAHEVCCTLSTHTGRVGGDEEEENFSRLASYLGAGVASSVAVTQLSAKCRDYKMFTACNQGSCIQCTMERSAWTGVVTGAATCSNDDSASVCSTNSTVVTGGGGGGEGTGGVTDWGVEQVLEFFERYKFPTEGVTAGQVDGKTLLYLMQDCCAEHLFLAPSPYGLGMGKLMFRGRFKSEFAKLV